MAKLIFVGTGSAFTVGDGNYQSNIVFESDSGKNLLIDCGTDARHALFDVGLTHRDIHALYISHLHADHVGGVEWLAFTNKFDAKPHTIELFCCEEMVPLLWEHVLSGGLSSIQGINADLHYYFHVHPIPINGDFTWEGTFFQLVQTVHVISGFRIMPSYGLLFSVGDETIFISTDTQFAPHQIYDFYRKATIIFHDCETAIRRSGIHAHYDELITLPKEIKKKMWLYHYQPGQLPDAEAEGFAGFVKKGQVFDFSHTPTCSDSEK